MESLSSPGRPDRFTPPRPLFAGDLDKRTRATIVLVGELRGWAASELAGHCAVLRRQSNDTITLDMSEVRVCDAAGLEVLVALHTGDAGPDFVILGARWSQFFGVLVETSLEDVAFVCHQIRQLVWSARRVRRVDVGGGDGDAGPALGDGPALR